MEKLRTNDFLINIEEFEDVAMQGDLRCSCSAKKFFIYHTGKQTKGVFAPPIVSKDKQLCVKAVCTLCGNNIVLYDSTTDGESAKSVTEDRNFEKFLLPKSDNDVWQIKMRYNYMPDEMKTNGYYRNDFVNCFIDIIDENGKMKRLIEE